MGTTGWGSGKAYDSANANKYCVGTTCDASNAADVATCTKTVAICSSFFATQGDGSAPLCGTGKVYDSSKATANCAAGTCNKDTPADVTACCKTGTPAKCSTKTTGWGATKAYDSADANKYCVGTACDASNTGDVATCTKGTCSSFFAITVGA